MFSANATKKSYKSCGRVQFRCTDQRYNLHTLSVNTNCTTIYSEAHSGGEEKHVFM